MNEIGRYGSVIEIDALSYMGTCYESPDKRITVAHGDRINSNNPNDRWVVILHGDQIVHQEKFSNAITWVVVKDSGLIFLELQNQTTGAISFVIMRDNGAPIFKGRGVLNFNTMVVLDDESWLIFEDGDHIKTLDLNTGKLGKKKELPSLRLDALRVITTDTVEAVMFGGELVSLKFR